jgi:hypothetical protein
MKLTTKFIKAKADFDYGKNNGLAYLQIVFGFATLFEVLKITEGLSRWWYCLFVPVLIIGSYLWGRYLRKINFRKREVSFINNENPEIMDLHKNLKDKN